MSILNYLLRRFFSKRPFFYGWEQRAFERRREQYPDKLQFPCRYGRD